jgi:hypothetical protein
VKALQQAWIQDGLTRIGVNRFTNILKRIFRWGVQEEIVSQDTYGAIKEVFPLRKGRTEAPEAGKEIRRLSKERQGSQTVVKLFDRDSGCVN